MLCAIALVIAGTLALWKLHPERSAADEALYDECLSIGHSPVACDAWLRVRHRLMDQADALAREEASTPKCKPPPECATAKSLEECAETLNRLGKNPFSQFCANGESPYPYTRWAK
jgi:hypothetical protein